MTTRLAYVLATWFGCGRVPVAPGTAGSLGALPLYLLLRDLGPYAVMCAALAITGIGVWASSHIARVRHEEDPQIVVIDEVAGMLVTLVPSSSALSIALGFVAFRVFDQWKPWPAYVCEARLPGGWGIVLDDVAAGVWAALLLAVLCTCFEL